MKLGPDNLEHCCGDEVYGLASKSQRETPDGRLMQPAGKLRYRLGWVAGITASSAKYAPVRQAVPIGGCAILRTPPSEFPREASHDAHVGRSVAGLARRFGALRRAGIKP